MFNINQKSTFMNENTTKAPVTRSTVDIDPVSFAEFYAIFSIAIKSEIPDVDQEVLMNTIKNMYLKLEKEDFDRLKIKFPEINIVPPNETTQTDKNESKPVENPINNQQNQQIKQNLDMPMNNPAQAIPQCQQQVPMTNIPGIQNMPGMINPMFQTLPIQMPPMMYGMPQMAYQMPQMPFAFGYPNQVARPPMFGMYNLQNGNNVEEYEYEEEEEEEEEEEI